jgi:hypothetical protein
MNRRIVWILLGIGLALVVAAAAAASAFWLTREHKRAAENGRPCANACETSVCVHEIDGDRYCAMECKRDSDCPSAFVCDPTLSRKHHVCLKSGVATGNGAHRRTR